MQRKVFKIIGMMVLVGNIGFSEYTLKDGKVYYNNNLVVKNLDINNFKILGNNYVTDENKIFFMNSEIKRVDIPTFEVLSSQLSKDKNNIYYKNEVFPDLNSNDVKIYNDEDAGVTYIQNNDKIYAFTDLEIRELQGVNLAAFEILKNGYSKDNKKVYYQGLVLENSNPATFKILNKSYSKDINNVYYLSEIVRDANVKTFNPIDDSYAKDNKNIFYENKVLKGADLLSFETFKDISFYGKDKNHVFYDGLKIPSADSKTFEILDYEYSKDKNHVYQKNKVVSKADPKTFELIPDTIYAKDNNYLFYNLNSLDRYDPQNFKIINSYIVNNNNKIYYIGIKLNKLDASTFDIVRGNNDIDFRSPYVKDKKRVYVVNVLNPDRIIEMIKGANPKNFEIIDPDYYMYTKDKKNIFYYDASTKISKIKGADLKTFKIFDNYFSKDKHAVYFKNSKLKGIKSKKFDILLENYSMYFLRDKDRVYLFTINDPIDTNWQKLEAIPTIDPDSFEVLDDWYFKDKNNVYYYDLSRKDKFAPIPLADTGTFMVLSEGYSKDANNVYYYGEKIDAVHPEDFKIVKSTPQGNFIKDANNVYLFSLQYENNNETKNKIKIFDNVDAPSFTMYNEYYGKDKNNIYYYDFSNTEELLKVNKANRNSFVALNEYYAKDKNNVYCTNKILKKADSQTFDIVTDEYTGEPLARDKNNIYNNYCEINDESGNE